MLFGTSFVDLMFGLKYNDAFQAIYRTRNNFPERIGAVLRRLPAEVKIFVLEYPEPWLRLILKFGQFRGCACAQPPCPDAQAPGR